MRSTFKTRRDMCYSVGRRAAQLKPHEAAAAWHDMAAKIESLGDADIPKFKDIIAAVRHANIFGKKSGAVSDKLRAAISAYWDHQRPKLHTDLPDSDLTVLMVTTDPEFPVWPGFHDGERWCSADASEFEGSILGWLHLDEAAALLRGKS